MSLEEEILAVRTSTAIADGAHLSSVRVSGPDAFEAMDRACPLELTLQDAQMKPSLLLDERAHPFADVYVCRDDESFFVLAEGPSPEELAAHLQASFPAGANVAVERLDGSHRAVTLHGPYAWELLAARLGPDVPGQPYLSLLREGGVLCFRGGKTGEYGYDLLVPEADAGAFVADLEERGRAFDLRRVGIEALDQCALENWFFNIRREGRAGLDVLELGLQWRVSYRKEFHGSTALGELRRRGAQRRLVCVIGEAPFAAGDAVVLGAVRLGSVVNAGFSPVRRLFVGAAVLDVRYAHPGVDRYAVVHDGAASLVRTVSPPVLVNRSLHVSPLRHGYATRGANHFPPISP